MLANWNVPPASSPPPDPARRGLTARRPRSSNPARARPRTCALRALESWGQNRRSKGRLTVNASSSSGRSAAKRPCQSGSPPRWHGGSRLAAPARVIGGRGTDAERPASSRSCPASQAPAPGGLLGHAQHGVVAGHRAQEPGHTGAVERRGDDVRAPWRRPDDTNGPEWTTSATHSGHDPAELILGCDAVGLVLGDGVDALARLEPGPSPRPGPPGRASTVAWVASTPSAASRSTSWGWLDTSWRARSWAMRCWRCAFVVRAGTRPGRSRQPLAVWPSRADSDQEGEQAAGGVEAVVALWEHPASGGRRSPRPPPRRPRWAGRQWKNSASGPPRPSAPRSTVKPSKARRRRAPPPPAPSTSTTSVWTASAPFTASPGRVLLDADRAQGRRAAPARLDGGLVASRAAQPDAHPESGARPRPATGRRCCSRPPRPPSCPPSGPRSWRMVSTSARACSGWERSESMFTTGTGRPRPCARPPRGGTPGRRARRGNRP